MSEQHDDLRRLATEYGHVDRVAISPERIIALLDDRDALEREVCACRAALEEVGYTGSLPEGVYDRLKRERDEARAALAKVAETWPWIIADVPVNVAAAIRAALAPDAEKEGA